MLLVLCLLTSGLPLFSQKILHTFTYDEVIWDATKDTFVIEYGPDEALQELSLITPQGSLIASLVTKAIKNLDKNDRRFASPFPHCL